MKDFMPAMCPGSIRLLALIATVAVWGLETPAAAPMGDAPQLFDFIDLARPELADVRRLADADDAAAAVREFVAVLAKRCAALPPQRGYGWWLHAPANADELLAGRLTTARYGDQSVHSTATIGLPGSIDFFAAAPGYPLTTRDISSMHWVNKYAEAYARSRDPRYLRAWCVTWKDFAAHWDEQLAAVRSNPDIWGKGPDGQQKLLGIGWVTNTLYTGWRLQAMREGLVGILQAAMAAGQLEEVDAEAVAAVLVRIATHEGPHARGLLTRAESTTPNQARSMAMELFRMGCLVPEFKEAAAWRTEPIEVLFLTNLPDGSDREQSLNYFNNPFRELPAQIRRDVPPAEQDAALLARIVRTSEYRDRFIPSLARPDGFPPATGTAPVWSKYNASQKLAPPSQAFTSIVFPYGGYAVQRDGWTPDSRYLFMKASRPSKGHWRSQDGGLQLAAFGRNLLVSPIGEVYDARDNDRGWRLYWDSSVSQNAIVVDGMASVERKGDFNALDAMRWHAGGRIDFMETEIRGPYRGPDFRVDGCGYAAKRRRGEVPDKATTGPEVTDVVHRRQVHFIRDAGCWIVTDRVTSEAPHDFTQTWCLGPEFSADDVVTETADDQRSGRIATTQPDGPNLSLFQCGLVELAHETYRGVYEDDRILGWVGILADREQWMYTPAVNVHATWRGQGEQLLVTLVVPHRGAAPGITVERAPAEERGQICGFEASLAGGRQVSYRASTAARLLESAGIRAAAASLLVVRDDNGLTGVVLDAESFDGEPAGSKDFEFGSKARDETAPTTVPIGIPSGFHWMGDGATLTPDYGGSAMP